MLCLALKYDTVLLNSRGAALTINLQNNHCILHAQLIRRQTLRLPNQLLTLRAQESVHCVYTSYFLCKESKTKTIEIKTTIHEAEHKESHAYTLF